METKTSNKDRRSERADEAEKRETVGCHGVSDARLTPLLNCRVLEQGREREGLDASSIQSKVWLLRGGRGGDRHNHGHKFTSTHLVQDNTCT